MAEQNITSSPSQQAQPNVESAAAVLNKSGALADRIIQKDDTLKVKVIGSGAQVLGQEYSETIAAIQTILTVQAGFKGQIDGRYGPETKAAIEAFQKERNLKVDGIVGSETLAALRGNLNDLSLPAPQNSSATETPSSNVQAKDPEISTDIKAMVQKITGNGDLELAPGIDDLSKSSLVIKVPPVKDSENQTTVVDLNRWQHSMTPNLLRTLEYSSHNLGIKEDAKIMADIIASTINNPNPDLLNHIQVGCPNAAAALQSKQSDQNLQNELLGLAAFAAPNIELSNENKQRRINVLTSIVTDLNSLSQN